jgi:hypothetical protein
LIITESEVDDLLERFGRALNATLDALPSGTVK